MIGQHFLASGKCLLHARVGENSIAYLLYEGHDMTGKLFPSLFGRTTLKFVPHQTANRLKFRPQFADNLISDLRDDSVAIRTETLLLLADCG